LGSGFITRINRFSDGLSNRGRQFNAFNNRLAQMRSNRRLRSPLPRTPSRRGGGAKTALKLAKNLPPVRFAIGIVAVFLLLVFMIVLLIAAPSGTTEGFGGAGGIVIETTPTPLPVNNPNLTLTKTASPHSVKLIKGHEKDARITYTIDVQIKGGGSASVTDSIPDNANYIEKSASPNPSSTQKQGGNLSSLTWDG